MYAVLNDTMFIHILYTTFKINRNRKEGKSEFLWSTIYVYEETLKQIK